MASRNDELHSTGFDILQDEVKYKRTGGCFVTTRKAIVYLIIAILASVLVGVFLYYYGPTDHSVKIYRTKSDDIEKLLNDSLESIPIQEVRLPTSVVPLHYRIKLHPVLDPSNFTFSGQIAILIKCLERSNKIEFNSVGMSIDGVEVRTTHVGNVHARSVRSAAEVSHPALNENGTLNFTAESRSTVNLTSTTPVSNILVLTTTKPNHHEVTHASRNISTTEANKMLQSTTPSTTSVAATTSTSTTAVYDDIKGYTFLRGKGEIIDIQSRTADKKDSKYKIQLTESLEAGQNYTLTIRFSGIITNNIKGLYTPSYVDGKGEKRWILATNFEPVFARESFPCFDEPSFKATFEISLARRTNMTAISNMPLRSTEPMSETGWVWDHFQTTPAMPTYLVAFAVFDFERRSSINKTAGPVFNIWAPSNKISNADYALEIGVKILMFYEKYFGINYSLPKVDLIAIPDLPKAVMEGWGLIFFRDTSLLLSSKASDFDTKREIFNFIAQELGQQWFGSLISLGWWNDVWLTEGFALFMAAEAEHSIENWLSDFTLKVTQYILNNDDFKSSHSLRINITNNLQINALLDSITHYKGSCILRMLNYSLPENTFKIGVQNYLHEWSGGLVNETNLWNSITQTVASKQMDLPQNRTVKEIMDTWTQQTGYPLVTVSRDYDTNSVNISQTRFQVLNNTDSSLWMIPLNYIVGDGVSAVRKLWLTNRSITLNNISGAINNTWMLFNIEQAGYYRVNYDISNWKLLEAALKLNPNNIPVLSRSELLNDAFELAENGILDYKIPFELAQYLMKETNYMPWSAVLSSLDLLHNILHTTYLNGAYEDYVIKLVSALYDNMGPTDTTSETANDKLLRTLIVKTACDVRYQPCVDWAQSQFKAWMNASSPYIRIPFNIRQTVLCTAVEMGGQLEWDFLWSKINPSMTSSDIEDAYMSLGCSRDIWLINRYLSYSINGTIPWQNVPLVWQSLAHSTGISVGFTFLRENWNKIYSLSEDKVVILKSIVTNFLYSLSTETDLEDLTLFFSKHEEDLQPLTTLIQGVVDRINARINWTNKYMKSIASWLTDNNYK